MEGPKVSCRLSVLFAEKAVAGEKVNHREFAEKAGIHTSTLSFIVNNKSLPSLPVALKIAKVINKPVEEIWVMEEE